MEMYKTIPREYQPKQLKASNTSLTEEFAKEYNQLFFKHLEKTKHYSAKASARCN